MLAKIVEFYRERHITHEGIIILTNYQSARVEDEIQWKSVDRGHQTPPSCSLHQAASSVSLHSLGQQVLGCQISI